MSPKTERLVARFPSETKALAERAALASGYTLTDYLVRLVLADAPKRLKAQQEIQLTNEHFDNFLAICEQTAAPSDKILETAKNWTKRDFSWLWSSTDDNVGRGQYGMK